jgi:predicted N-formylglutamate amidohydrolase
MTLASMTQTQTRLLITCEHGGNEVPAELEPYFASADAMRQLNSHRGYDPGSLSAAKSIAEHFDSDFEFSAVSRLVVDLNRSLDSPQLFSKFLEQAPAATKIAILQAYYHPYRERVTERVKQWVVAGQHVLHLSIHTFTPRWRGTVRKFDVGVLFDPERQRELGFSQAFLSELKCRGFRAFPNQPYLGIDDGLTTALRKQFTDDQYAGIEIELNNRIARLSEKTVASWQQRIASAIQIACDRV